MAKINMVFDTVEKTFVADVDGQPLENVDSLSVYCTDWKKKEEYCLRLEMCEKMKDEEYHVRHTVTASDKGELQSVEQVKVKDVKFINDILNYFGCDK